MPFTVDFKPIANLSGADVLSQAAYVAYLAGAGADGYPSGILNKETINKTQRQTSVMAAVLANFISEYAQQDVLDSDNAVASLVVAMNSAIIASANVVSDTGFPPNYLTGLTLANNSGTPNTYVDIGVGSARDSADAYDMTLAAGVSKIIQASGSWAAGSNNNGLFSGARASSTWYNVFLIRKDADGTIDAGFDTSFTAANRPAGYTNYRRVGAVLTDGSGNIRRFFQFGRTFIWSTPSIDVSQTVDNSVAVNVTLAVPPGLSVMAEVDSFSGQGHIGGGYYGEYTVLRNPSTTDTALSIFTMNGGATGIGVNNTANALILKEFVPTNTSAQIGARCLVSNTLQLMTIGWTEF